jgi:hypothetical protein
MLQIEFSHILNKYPTAVKLGLLQKSQDDSATGNLFNSSMEENTMSHQQSYTSHDNAKQQSLLIYRTVHNLSKTENNMHMCTHMHVHR